MPTRPLVTSYRDDLRRFSDRWSRIGLALVVALALAFPFLADAQWMSIGNQALVAIVGAVGMMILTGFCGQISLGHAAFLALGAYTAAVLGVKLHVPWFLTLPAAGLVAAAVGLLVGPFALRLRGLYLAIVTLGLLFVVEHLLSTATSLTGGVAGTSVPMHSAFGEPDPYSLGDFWDDLSIAGITLKFEQKLWFLFLSLAAVATWCASNLARSNTGRAMMAVRDHDLAAAVLGVNPARQKVVAFGLSSFFAGLAGAMFGFQQQMITVVPPFDLNMSVQYIAMIVLGGIGTVFGAVWGALAFVALSPVAELIGGALPLVRDLTSAQQSTLLFSMVVIAFLVFEPLGLYGVWLRIKRYFAAWPFRY